MARKELIDVIPTSLQLIESGGKAGKTVVRGEFARAGVATENKRLYSQKIWANEMKRLESKMNERNLFGEIDHPTDGRTSLQRVSHIVTGMKLDDGILVGEAEILPTEKGKILEALLKSGCKVGVSSRGFGSVRSNDEGVDEVQDDYRLVTFDFVADPADATAYPDVFFEGVEFPMAKLNENSREDSDVRRHAVVDKKKAAEWAKALEAEVAKEESGLPDKLLATLANMRAELREEIRGELLSDPSVAGSFKVVEQIKSLVRPYILPEDAEAIVSAKDDEIKALKKRLAEQELRIQDLEEEGEKLGNVAKEAGYKFYLERVLRDDPDGELVRNLLGDVKKFSSAAELKARVESVREQLAAKRTKAEAADAKLVEQAEQISVQAQSLVEEANARAKKSEDISLRLAQTNKQMALKLYTAQKLRSHPRAAKISALIESSGAASTDDIDALIEQHTESDPHDLDEASDMRARIRRRLGSRTMENSVLTEETRTARETDLFEVPMSTLQRMAGINRR